jgi:hypothetical protein
MTARVSSIPSVAHAYSRFTKSASISSSVSTMPCHSGVNWSISRSFSGGSLPTRGARSRLRRSSRAGLRPRQCLASSCVGMYRACQGSCGWANSSRRCRRTAGQDRAHTPTTFWRRWSASRSGRGRLTRSSSSGRRRTLWPGGWQLGTSASWRSSKRPGPATGTDQRKRVARPRQR